MEVYVSRTSGTQWGGAGEELLEGTSLSCAPGLVRKPSWLRLLCLAGKSSLEGTPCWGASAFFPKADDLPASIQGN